jgi:hypothetical protein
MQRIVLLTFALAILAAGFACNNQKAPAVAGSSGDSPTESYKRLYIAVKAKDIETIKNQLTKKSIEFAQMAAARNNTQGDKIYENGFTATTFADTMPEIRDERVKDEMGAVEVWNSKDSKWEDLPFIKEDGSWKLAIGELFGGSYKLPGKGRDATEKEAANMLATNTMPVTNSTNTSAIPITNAAKPPPPVNEKKAK